MRREYRRRFPEKLARLATGVEELAGAPSAARAHAALRMEVHRLHGSAATYGLDEAGAILADWDARLNRRPPPAGPMPPRSIAALRRLLRRLERAPGGTG
jgi:hypothetical protein